MVNKLFANYEKRVGKKEKKEEKDNASANEGEPTISIFK